MIRAGSGERILGPNQFTWIFVTMITVRQVTICLFTDDLPHRCLRKIAWGVKEWGILGQWKSREGVCIHTSSVRSGIRFKALVRIWCIAKTVTALWDFWTVQQLATRR